jgi:beta-lactamase class A
MDTRHIASIFDRFTTGYHFYLEDLRSGERVELGDRGPWPIGSCFKLAVLVAYFEALIDGSLPPDSLDAETVIPPERFSTGGGVITLLDSPIRLTDRHLLHWMLAASDGTATDVLIAKLGLTRVQKTLSRLAPSSTLACNLNDMVERFRLIPGALDCKTRLWSPEDALQFRRATCELGETNAADLAVLALKTFQFLPPPRGKSDSCRAGSGLERRCSWDRRSGR